MIGNVIGMMMRVLVMTMDCLSLINIVLIVVLLVMSLLMVVVSVFQPMVISPRW